MRNSLFLPAMVALLAACGKKPASAPGAGMSMMDRVQPVETLPITIRTLEETIDLVGSIAANESAELRPEIAGTLTEINFQEGAHLGKGDVLAKIDTRELEAQVAEAGSNFALAQKTLERARVLVADDAVSQLEVDAAVADHDKLKAALGLLEVKLAKATITSPFDGIAGARTLSVGDYVTPQSVITTVDDLSRLKVELQVPERYLPLLKVGGTFSVRVAMQGESAPITGKVYFISPSIDESTRSALVKGYVENAPPSLKPGMFANVTLVLRTVENALVVPETSILSTPRGTVVIEPQEKDGTLVAAFVPVQTGMRVPGYVQVSPVGPPLKPGDKVVSAGVGGIILIPGMKLSLVEPVVTPDKPSETDRKLK